jgi:hypothetical protein
MHTYDAQQGHGTEQVMNSRMMRWVYRTVPLFSSLVVAAASFALSFVALRDVAASTGAVPGHLAWLVPIVIDGGVMCASAVIWATAAMQHRRQLFPFVVVFVLVALSVVVNAAHAGPSLLAKVIAALPPLVLLATLELVAITTRSSSAAGGKRPLPAAPPRVNTSGVVEDSLADLEADFVAVTPSAGDAPRPSRPGASSRRQTRVRAIAPDAR